MQFFPIVRNGRRDLMKSFDETEWVQTKSLLREHLTAPRLADSEKSRVVEEFEQRRRRATADLLPLRWLAWSGAFSLLLAAILTALVLPQQIGRLSQSDFKSQVISVRAERPELSVSAFPAPDQRGVVIWIEGADYIPAEVAVR